MRRLCAGPYHSPRPAAPPPSSWPPPRAASARPIATIGSPSALRAAPSLTDSAACTSDRPKPSSRCTCVVYCGPGGVRAIRRSNEAGAIRGACSLASRSEPPTGRPLREPVRPPQDAPLPSRLPRRRLRGGARVVFIQDPARARGARTGGTRLRQMERSSACLRRGGGVARSTSEAGRGSGSRGVPRGSWSADSLAKSPLRADPICQPICHGWGAPSARCRETAPLALQANSAYRGSQQTGTQEPLDFKGRLFRFATRANFSASCYFNLSPVLSREGRTDEGLSSRLSRRVTEGSGMGAPFGTGPERSGVNSGGSGR